MMKSLKGFVVFIVLLTFTFQGFADSRPEFNKETQDTLIVSEPPHVFFEGPSMRSFIIKENKVIEMGKDESLNYFEQNFAFPFLEHVQYINSDLYNSQYQFDNVSEFLIISDIHGQYDLFKEILINHQVVDSNLNWIYGNKHLVILGDIMGRGPQVSEALWLVFKLEAQALKNQGKVHYLAGNHELMVLDNDLRYLNPKYLHISSLLNKTVAEIYGANSLIGSWLHKRPVMIKLNDLLVVHAGVSPEFLEKKLPIDEVNKHFIYHIYPIDKSIYRQDSLHNLLARTPGPLWYRGYFSDPPLGENDFLQALKFYNGSHMVVGHTSFKEIQYLYGGRLFGIDASIKNGKNGQVLIYKNGTYLRGLKDGTTQPF